MFSNTKHVKKETRKCVKCQRSTATEPSLVLYHFPRPGPYNVRRAQEWARFCYPDQEWASSEFQKKLFNGHKMLCYRHFAKDSFVDYANKKLHRYSVPCHNDNQEPTTSTQVDMLVNVPSLQVFGSSTSKSQAEVSAVVTEPEMAAAATETPSIDMPVNVPSLQAFGASTSKSQAEVSAVVTEPEMAAAATETPSIDMPVNVPSLQAFGASTSKSQVEVSAVATKPEMAAAASGTPSITHGFRVRSEREKKLYNTCRKNVRLICKLKNKLRKMNKDVILEALLKDEAVENLSNHLTSSFAVLLQGQLSNFKKRPKGRRWNLNQKIIALRLYKRSPTCYRLLRRLFPLPCPTTIKTLLNYLPLNSGINPHVFDALKKVTKNQIPEHNECILMFDEMSIRKNLTYNRKKDLIYGYQDHGSQGRDQQIASYALVFMIAGVRKNYKQPVAYYLSGESVTADRVAVLIKEVLHQCFLCGINICATVCDLDGVNRKALGILGASTDHPYFQFNEHEVVALYDAPHLLKCFRNLFMKYNIKFPTDITSDGKTGQGIAKWEHIKLFYEIDNQNPFFVFAPALTKYHIEPNSKQKMKVKLAAQVLSHTVSAGIYAKTAQGELPAEANATATLVDKMDKLFDSLNANSPDLKRGKRYSTNISNRSPHLGFYKEMVCFMKSIEFIGLKNKAPSQDGWIQTMLGVERLWNNLKKKYPHMGSLATRRLQQDPLENCFGCVRSNCGSNVNPTVEQFIAGLKTAIISNLSHGSKKQTVRTMEQ